MGILDELKQEATKKQRQQVTEENLEQQRETRYRDAILPAMQKAFLFMQELVEHLSFLEHAIVVKQYSSHYPQFGTLTQQDYKIYTDDHGGFADFDRLMQITVRFFCVGPGSFRYELESKGRIEREVSFLSSRHLSFDWVLNGGNSAMQRASFTVVRKIPVRFKFEVDYANSTIHLMIHNHESFSSYKKTFTAEQVNDELLDEIARFMLRRDSNFICLDISLDHKQRIKHFVQQKHQEELALMAKLSVTEAPSSQPQESPLSERLKQLLTLKKPS